LSDRPTLQELLEIQEHFGLPSTALVEKDWHVVKALAAIMAADVNPFRLVFGGGTALGRAYGLIRRMSEDVDLRIVGDKTPTRGQLRHVRTTITDALLKAGFKFDPTNPVHRMTKHEGRYTIYQIPYDPVAEGSGALRPEIQIETAVFPLRREAVQLPVSSFVAEGYARPAEIPAIPCASISETAAEKLVALTRRAGAELAGLREKRDSTLVRHLNDLHAIRDHYDASDVAGLAREIMHADAARQGKDFPAYQAEPLGETLKAIEGIAASPDYAADYATFRRDMVYGEEADFRSAVATLKKLGEHLQRAAE
jgi:predicted nucleotidyltransferase component of viral defense system